MKLRHFWIFGMVCVLLSATAFSAQSTTATIQGLVSDEQKALVPGVTITARNLETNATRSAVSNDDTSRMTVAELLKAGGSSLYSILPSGVRVGNVGRNTLRADGIGNRYRRSISRFGAEQTPVRLIQVGFVFDEVTQGILAGEGKAEAGA